jgi:DNA-binding phage protein
MNTRKTIYDKLFTEKVELAKHEVELGLIDDVDKVFKEAMAARKKAQDVFFNTKKAVEAAVQKGLKEIKEYKAINEKALPQFDKLNKFVKEVGITMPPVYKDHEENIKSGLKNSFPSQIKTLESINVK